MNCYSKEITNEIAPKFGLCYATMMQTRNHELSLLQRFSMILLIEGNAKKKVTILCFHSGNYTSKLRSAFVELISLGPVKLQFPLSDQGQGFPRLRYKLLSC